MRTSEFRLTRGIVVAGLACAVIALAGIGYAGARLQEKSVAVSDAANLDKNQTISAVTARPFALKVSCDAGAVGTPVTGTYYYPANTTVNYSYKQQIGYAKLQVKLDDVLVASSGRFVMNRNHTLTADGTSSNSCTLDVKLDNGVLNPNPPGGTSYFTKGSTVNYSYKVGANRGVEVLVNGVSKCKHWPSSSGSTCSGSFVINANSEIWVLTL